MMCAESLPTRKFMRVTSLFRQVLPTSRKDSWSVLGTGRYAHKQSYIRELAKATGFKVVRRVAFSPRRENGKGISGQIFILKATV